MQIIYFLVALIATTIGALAGLGGGVIIKPSLDLLGHYDLSTISMLSTFTVFSMAVVSTYKQIKKGFSIEKRLVFMAIGATLGGILGQQLFKLLLTAMDSDLAAGMQSIMLAVLLVIVLFKKYLPDWDVQNPIVILLVGLTLGTTASFLGIGGGPINVAVIMMFLKMDIKEAAVASVFVILLSQLSKILSTTVTGGMAGIDFSMLVFMIPAAIAGGFLGFKLNRNLAHDHIEKIFNVLVAFLVLMNLFNAYRFLA